MREQLIEAANRFALGGIAMLILAMTGSILLVTHITLHGSVAAILTAIAFGWLVLWWYLVPLWERRGNGSD